MSMSTRWNRCSLNRAAAPHGLWFGPDVATASRANLGGMIGNNSAGSRSIVYGKTLDHVRRLGVVLADGAAAELGPLSPAEWDARSEQRSAEGALYRRIRDYLYDRDVVVAGRPLPEGVPISSSRRGSVSRGQ